MRLPRFEARAHSDSRPRPSSLPGTAIAATATAATAAPRPFPSRSSSLAPRMSTTATVGRLPPPTRSSRVSRWYFPACAFIQLSRLGVALPSTTVAPSSRPRITATSRAW